jgi:hypothetical protein
VQGGGIAQERNVTTVPHSVWGFLCVHPHCAWCVSSGSAIYVRLLNIFFLGRTVQSSFKHLRLYFRRSILCRHFRDFSVFFRSAG